MVMSHEVLEWKVDVWKGLHNLLGHFVELLIVLASFSFGILGMMQCTG